VGGQKNRGRGSKESPNPLGEEGAPPGEGKRKGGVSRKKKGGAGEWRRWGGRNVEKEMRRERDRGLGMRGRRVEGEKLKGGE